MAAFRLLLVAAFAVSTALAHLDDLPGFLSISCGLEANYSSQHDESTGIFYVPDGPYVDGGESHRTSDGTVRSFPTGARNCFAVPTESGSRYMVSLGFAYRNYDGLDSALVEFDLSLGATYWDTASVRPSCAPTSCSREAIFVAWASWTPVCLENTDRGTPFASVLELRLLGSSLYPPVTAGLFLSRHDRFNLGAASFIRYPADQYDRGWWPMTGPSFANLSTSRNIQQDINFKEPPSVLQTAVTLTSNATIPIFTWTGDSLDTFMVFLHFADFQDSQVRQFDIYLNGNKITPEYEPYSPLYLAAFCVYNTGPFQDTNGEYNITIAATATSVLPPMLNALEIFRVVTHDSHLTFPKDFDAIMAIKVQYGVKKNWMGDPCIPPEYAWEGLKCSRTNDNIARITFLNLSKSNLHGLMSSNFTLLTALEYLDLSYNNLSGPIPELLASFPSLQVLNLSGNHMNGQIPDSLCKKSEGPLYFRYDSDGDACNKTSSSSSKNKTVLVVSVVVSVVVLVAVVLAAVYVIWRIKRTPKDFIQESPKDLQFDNVPESGIHHEDHLQKTENRRFTYKELELITSKFEQFIGQGGFGLVYYGRLEDGTEVAVKMCSETSSHGFEEFLAEVRSLTTVHHRNLVSLVGYCWEEDHLALVYEYMSRGNLCDHLRGKSGAAEVLNWRTRLRVVLEAAQGLDYLHKGCSLPIIHRDVKTNNILLGQNLQAKIADFGLCKTYASETQTHVSATAAGTAGYIDPEYYRSGRLTESSDVYSFGVVLLEVATGEPPIVPGHGHIVHRMKQKISTGNISSVADTQLGGAYDITSMWKVVDTAMACTSDAAARRPAMAAVVAQLKESLALDEAREDSGVRGSPMSDTAALVSAFGPSAR